MPDTTLRYMVILREIPRGPPGITTTQLKAKLDAADLSVDLRTIERSLEKLSGPEFPLVCDDRTKPYHWYFKPDAPHLDIPGLDPQTSLTLVMVKQFLEPLMPRSSLVYLAPYFDRAREVLESGAATDLYAWPPKVRVVPKGPPLAPPAVRQDVLDTVYEALLKEQRFKAEYRRRGETDLKEYVVNPLGLIVRPPGLYLVACLRDYDNAVQLVLHRMQSAALMDEPRRVPEGFDLDEYIAQGYLGFRRDEPTIHLTAVFEPGPAVTLLETPISLDQTSTVLDDKRVQIDATVPNNEELRAWLRSYGELVEVLAPADLRAELITTATHLAARYGVKGE